MSVMDICRLGKEAHKNITRLLELGPFIDYSLPVQFPRPWKPGEMDDVYYVIASSLFWEHDSFRIFDTFHILCPQQTFVSPHPNPEKRKRNRITIYIYILG